MVSAWALPCVAMVAHGNGSVTGSVNDRGAPPVEAATPHGLSDNGVKALQTGAFALGGADLALGGLWLYRRRQVSAT